MAWRGSSLGVCRSCGATIVWMRMKTGKSMPCDSNVISYVRGGKERIVSEDGEVVAATIVSGEESRDGRGYISHFATCPNAGQHRKRGA